MDLPIGAPGRTLGYVTQDLTPTGSNEYLAKCSRCSWAATFTRPTRALSMEDLEAHLVKCRGDR